MKKGEARFALSNTCQFSTRLLDPAFFSVIARSTLVQRCAQTILDHVGRVQIGQCRMQLLELIKVLKNSTGQLIHRLGRGLGGRDHRGHHTVGIGGLRIVRIKTARDGGFGIKGLLGHQLVHHGPCQ